MRSFKKISPSRLSSISPNRQLGVILRRGVQKIIRIKSGHKGSFPIDTQNPAEALRLIQTMGTTLETRKYLIVNATKRKTIDRICGCKWDAWPIPGDTKYMFLSTLVVRYHKERRTIQVHVKYFRPYANLSPLYRQECFQTEIIGRQDEKFDE